MKRFLPLLLVALGAGCLDVPLIEGGPLFDGKTL